MFEYLLYLFIPALIVIESTAAFLLVMSCVIGIRIYWYIKNEAKFRRKNSLKERIFTTLNLLIWLTHHSAYLIFFVFEKVLQYNESFSLEDKNTISNITKYCRFVSLFTVLAGGLCQIISFFFTILINVIKLIKYICKKIRNPEKLGQAVEKKEERRQKEKK